MIWIILAIIVAAYIIGEAIKNSNNSTKMLQTQAINTQIEQEKQRVQRDIDSKYPPGSDGFKLIKTYIDIEARRWLNQQSLNRKSEAEELVKSGKTKWVYIKNDIENEMEDNRKRYAEIKDLRKEYALLSKKLGYEATDILVDNWPKSLRLRWEVLEQQKLDSYKRR